MDGGNFEAGCNPSPHTSYTRGYLHQVFPVLFHQICKSRLQSETHPSNYGEYTAAKCEIPASLSALTHSGALSLFSTFFQRLWPNQFRFERLNPRPSICISVPLQIFSTKQIARWQKALAPAAISCHTGAYQCAVFFLLLSSLLIILKPGTSVKWYTSSFSSFFQILSPICSFPLSLQAIKLQDCLWHKVLLSGLFLIQHMEP